MEYIEDRGTYFDAVPFDKIIDTFKEIYKPGYINGAGGDFQRLKVQNKS